MISLSVLLLTRLEHIINKQLSREQIETMQIRKFRRLVSYIAKHSDYYQKIIRDNQIDLEKCVPSDFPILTKTDLMKNFDAIVTDKSITLHRISQYLEEKHDPAEMYEGKYTVIHTSGTSGQIGIFVYSDKEWTKGIAQTMRYHGAAPRKRNLAFFGSIHGNVAGISFVSTAKKSILRFFYNIRCYDINSPLQNVIEALNDYQPDIMVGYTSGLRLLAASQLRGDLDIHPQIVENSGEAVGNNDQKLIEKAFGLPIVNVYSCSEHMLMGTSFPGHEGIVLFEDDLIFEFHEDCTYITNLFNYTEPLIRYRMDDVLEPRGIDTDYPFINVRAVVGRMESAPVFINERGEEDYISPSVIIMFFVEGLDRFQMKIEGTSAFTFRAQLSPDQSEEQRQHIFSEIHRYLDAILAEKNMRNVEYEIKEVEELKADPKTRKFRLIVTATNDMWTNPNQQVLQ